MPWKNYLTYSDKCEEQLQTVYTSSSGKINLLVYAICYKEVALSHAAETLEPFLDSLFARLFVFKAGAPYS